jgi:biopolymer transport protein ExbD
VSWGDARAGLRKRQRRGMAVIDLTPLIDIVFQLIIFFLLTATFQQNPAFKVKLPKAKNQEVSKEPKAVVVVVNSSGEFEVEGKHVDPRELEMRLCAAAQADSSTAVNIKADQATQHQFVVQIMDIAKGCKLERLGILHGR